MDRKEYGRTHLRGCGSNAFTMAGAGQRTPLKRLIGLRSAFTMAEILLSLTIIGVVAAITLPSLTGNINERTWNTQRKALYARMSQAISLMPALNGYGNSENFITSGLAKVLKINNICSDTNLEDCGFPTAFNNISGGKVTPFPNKPSLLNPLNTSMSFSTTAFVGSYTNPDNPAAAFETANGESILAYYTQTCKPSKGEQTWYYIAEKVCVNFIFDLNGKKGPNTVGKDIGIMTVFYPTDSVVAMAEPHPRNAGIETTFEESNKKCTELDNEYRAPNVYELMTMFYNANLVNFDMGRHYWSNTRLDSTKAWLVSTSTGRVNRENIDVTDYKRVRCVKR